MKGPTLIKPPAPDSAVQAHGIVELHDNIVWVRVTAAGVDIWDIHRGLRAFSEGRLGHVGGWDAP